MRKIIVLLSSIMTILALSVGTASATNSAASHKRITYNHICMALDHSLCITSRGVGLDLEVTSGSPNRWQAIPDGSSGDIMWQNGSGNCMYVSSGAVINEGSNCGGVAAEDWTIGGSGNLTFNNSGTELYMGTNGAQDGKFVYAHPAMQGFDRGWVLEPA